MYGRVVCKSVRFFSLWHGEDEKRIGCLSSKFCLLIAAEVGGVDDRIAEPLDEVLEFFRLELSVFLDKFYRDKHFGDVFELDEA